MRTLMMLCGLLCAASPAAAQSRLAVFPIEALEAKSNPVAAAPMAAPPAPAKPTSSRTCPPECHGTANADMLAQSDCANHVHYQATTPITVTVPSNLYNVCDVSLWQDQAGGQLTVVPGTGVTFHPSPSGLTKSSGAGSQIIVNFLMGGPSPDHTARYNLTGMLGQ